MVFSAGARRSCAARQSRIEEQPSLGPADRYHAENHRQAFPRNGRARRWFCFRSLEELRRLAEPD